MKSDQVMAKQCLCRQSGIWPIWTLNLFCPAFTLTLIYKPILKSIRPKLAILSPKNHYNGHISKPHFAKVSIIKKPTPPKFFNKIISLNPVFFLDFGLNFFWRPKSKISRR